MLGYKKLKLKVKKMLGKLKINQLLLLYLYQFFL